MSFLVLFRARPFLSSKYSKTCLRPLPILIQRLRRVLGVWLPSWQELIDIFSPSLVSRLSSRSRVVAVHRVQCHWLLLDISQLGVAPWTPLGSRTRATSFCDCLLSRPIVLPEFLYTGDKIDTPSPTLSLMVPQTSKLALVRVHFRDILETCQASSAASTLLLPSKAKRVSNQL